jgi:hypothetical protein
MGILARVAVPANRHTEYVALCKKCPIRRRSSIRIDVLLDRTVPVADISGDAAIALRR